MYIFKLKGMGSLRLLFHRMTFCESDAKAK